jgi:hypothetical protein
VVGAHAPLHTYDQKINGDNDLNMEEILRSNNYEFWFTFLTFKFVQVQAGSLQPLQLWREHTGLESGIALIVGARACRL